jgi:hypothetical protein
VVLEDPSETTSEHYLDLLFEELSRLLAENQLKVISLEEKSDGK